MTTATDECNVTFKLDPSQIALLRAFTECSGAVQESIRELMDIVCDPKTDADDREMALVTIGEALYPQSHNGHVGVSLEEADEIAIEHRPDAKQALEAIEAEEASFAACLERLMRARGLNQTQLAERVGVGQPAISMMLRRQCRPQRRTLNKLAEALDIPVSELWPG